MCVLFVVGTAADAVDVLKLAPSDELSAENGVVTFDGKSVAVDVNQQDVFGAGGLTSQFTISTWMRHENGDDDQVKQHVMCSSDAEGYQLLFAGVDTFSKIWHPCHPLTYHTRYPTCDCA